MSPKLYDRRVKVTLNGRVFEGDTYVDGRRVPGFHITFLVEHSLEKTGNKAEVTIANLSADSRNAVDQHKAKKIVVPTRPSPTTVIVPATPRQLILEAGYEGSTGVLFSGEATHIVHERTPTGFITRASVADSLQARKQLINTTMPKGATLNEAIKKAAEALKVDIKNAMALVLKGDFDTLHKKYFQGLSVSMPAHKFMDDLAKTGGFSWSIQNNELAILKDDQYLDPVQIVLSPQSGLVGSPHKIVDLKHLDKSIVVARSLLQASLTMGKKVVLDSSEMKGTFKIVKTKHVGDTHGADWYSEPEMIKVSV